MPACRPLILQACILDTQMYRAVLDDQEETGWKYVHGDVFRFPPQRSLFCAFVGTGSQVLPSCRAAARVSSLCCSAGAGELD